MAGFTFFLDEIFGLQKIGKNLINFTSYIWAIGLIKMRRYMTQSIFAYVNLLNYIILAVVHSAAWDF